VLHSLPVRRVRAVRRLARSLATALTLLAATSLVAASGEDPLEPHRVVLPDNYHGQPVRLVIWFHGAVEDESLAIDNPSAAKDVAALTAHGYLVVTSRAHGDNWGSPISREDYVRLYDWITHRYRILSTFFVARSMGGLDSLMLLHDRAIPARAFVGIVPVTNITNMLATPSHDNIVKGYGGQPGKSPVDYSDYPDIPYLFFASYDDTVVDRRYNTDLLQVPDKTVVTTHGEHGDPDSTVHPDEIVDFFDRVH
jgi:hypothetical protein